LIGFIKETTLIFLGCFIFLRFAKLLLRIVSSSNFGKPNSRVDKVGTISHIRRQLTKELGIAFSILFPGLYYLLLRNTLIHTRTFMPNITNLADASLYGVVIKSYVEQFGGFLFLFIGGMILLIRGKSYTIASFLILIVITYPVVHILDHKEYTGYSRFNLFVLPPLLAGSAITISRLLEKNKFIGILISILVIFFNLQHTPIQIDGTKIPGWGTYLLNVSEQYYPYDEAFSWVSENYRREQILIAGYNYPYFFDFYFQQLDWKPNYRKMITNDAPNESDTLSRAIDRAKQTGCTVILFHVMGQSPPRLNNMGGYREIRVFENMSHTLVVYRLEP
jgi:hypothetical protein